MRTTLAAVGLTLLVGACGGSSGGTSGTSGASGGISGVSSGGISGASSGRATTGASSGGTTVGSPTTTGGSTTGVQATTGGSGSAGLAPGQPCSANADCTSNVCGIAGSGKCCTSACDTTDGTCGATACGDNGACVFPTSAKACGGSSCQGNALTGASCNGSGSCVDAGATACQGGFTCDDGGTACLTTCVEDRDCTTGLACNRGSCAAPSTTGPCSSNSDCVSGVCGGLSDAGTAGACCETACPSSAAACASTTCNLQTGACIYPSGASCGPAPVCENATLTVSACDAQGDCVPGQQPCGNQLACDSKQDACNTSCAQDSDCASGAWCNTDAGACLAQFATGTCGANDECTSGVCGIAGTGHCCSAACSNVAAPCGATDCDGKSGACSFPDNATLCGSVAQSCTGTTQQNPSSCDGTGNCNNAPGTTDCSPYACGPTACLNTCAASTSCAGGDFCDPTNSACCSGLTSGGTVTVDSQNGKDAACCGIGTNPACQTLFQAMTLIDAAQATGVTITASVGGVGGDWAPAKEVYPIVLGWGVELSAPGVFFTDFTAKQVIDITPFSTFDTVGTASIVGSAAGGLVGIGMDSLGNQSTDSSALRVESGQTLSIAYALINGNAAGGTTALSVAAGANLLLGSDQSGLVFGSVAIGSPTQSDGWDGLVCETDSTTSTGCTITDATLSGASSVVIVNQEDQDLSVGDFGSVTLNSAPAIGMTPTQPGFLQCVSKNDMSSSQTGAVLVKGSATVSFTNGFVQCIDGPGFELEASSTGVPNLTLTGTTIQNTEMAIYASAGSASVSNGTIQFNYEGVEQDTDGTNNGAIDLSGGGVGTTTVVCSASAESATGANNGPGVDVWNNTANDLNAADVDWDTSGPDLFTCGAHNAGCNCVNATCTALVGTDDMNAVESSTGAITVTNNGTSATTCALPGVFCDAVTAPCRAWESCCKPPGGRKSQCVQGPACN